jgi:Na+/H+ antiporter NhaD/arsenite permease-like protein
MGDVTTSMLWIGGQVSTTGVIASTLLPSLAVALLPAAVLSWKFRGVSVEDFHTTSFPPPSYSSYVLGLGLTMFLLVPLMTALLHIPPVLCMLLALGIMWVGVSIIHRDLEPEEQLRLGVAQALRNVDTPTILFFSGLLLSISALSAIGTIRVWADFLVKALPQPSAIAVALGLASGVIDNIPLVAAAQKMFSLQTFGTDHPFWSLLALATGTGGSIVIFGSATGVAVMGMEEISIGWYFRRVSLLAALGFAAGIGVFLLLNA